jgi:predicted HTH transcriptional regulator
MSIPIANLKDLSEDDLNALVQNGVTESNSLEFKRQTYGTTEAEKKELLKDVTAFANSIGGDLVLGVDEQDGVATGLVPLTGNAENEVDRLNQILRSGVEPPLLGLSIVPVQVNSGACIIIRVPRSPLAPHRVSAYGSSRFYVRHGRSRERRSASANAVSSLSIRCVRDV